MSGLDLTGMTVTHAAPVETEPETVDRSPVITEKQKADNLRRVKAPALVHVNADGTRSWKHSIVQGGDGIRDSNGVDRGAGTSDSITLLRAETTKSTGPARDASGRFTKR